VAGTPYLSGDVTALGVNNRAFYALGTHQPGRREDRAGDITHGPRSCRSPVRTSNIEMPSMAVDRPAGQSLSSSLPRPTTCTPASQPHARAVVLQNAKVALPIVASQ